jgi:hypothetical protein
MWAGMDFAWEQEKCGKKSAFQLPIADCGCTEFPAG